MKIVDNRDRNIVTFGELEPGDICQAISTEYLFVKIVQKYKDNALRLDNNELYEVSPNVKVKRVQYELVITD